MKYVAAFIAEGEIIGYAGLTDPARVGIKEGIDHPDLVVFETESEAEQLMESNSYRKYLDFRILLVDEVFLDVKHRGPSRVDRVGGLEPSEPNGERHE